MHILNNDRWYAKVIIIYYKVLYSYYTSPEVCYIYNMYVTLLLLELPMLSYGNQVTYYDVSLSRRYE